MSTSTGSTKTPRQQLSASMEHIRSAVTFDPVPRPKATPSPSIPEYASEASSEIDPSRSHDPLTNTKRTDPFQFGSRFLEAGDDPFAYNAWDHVEVDASYLAFTEQQFAFQRSAPVSDFEKKKFNAAPEKFWNAFYTNNTSNFFKDRKWLRQEFPVLSALTRKDAGSRVLLEVGAGAGNTAFPILESSENLDLRIHACDFSAKAVEIIRGNAAYEEPRIRADVWDVAADELPPGLEEESVDVVMLIFIFSALTPRQWAKAVHNVHRLLKPGGHVLFRDYGRGDLAQVRFKKGRWLEENFYIRGDGTRVYFFEEEELRDIWTGRCPTAITESETGAAPDISSLDIADTPNETGPNGTIANGDSLNSSSTPIFEVLNLAVDRRMIVNRQRKLKMYRCWLQAQFRMSGPHTVLDDVPAKVPRKPAPNEFSQLSEKDREGVAQENVPVDGDDGAARINGQQAA